MKKMFVVLALCFTIAAFAAAEGIDLGTFPAGEWLDDNYDALWTFTADNIQLYRTDGTLVYDFRGEIEDFDLKVTVSGLELSFSCIGTARSYRFIKGVTDKDLKLVIDTDGGDHYEKDMPMQ